MIIPAAIMSCVTVAGRELPAYTIPLTPAPLIVVSAPRGFAMCGYLDVAAADRLAACACVIPGVRTPEELLAGPVTGVSAAAQAGGVAVGMSGRQALEKML